MTGEEHITQPRVLVGPCLLLLLAEHRSHGYELMDRMRAMGFHWHGGPGPIYRELRLMEKDGLVRSSVEPQPTGPVRIVYDLTEEGRAELGSIATHLDELTAVTQRLLHRIQSLNA